MDDDGGRGMLKERSVVVKFAWVLFHHLENLVLPLQKLCPGPRPLSHLPYPRVNLPFHWPFRSQALGQQQSHEGTGRQREHEPSTNVVVGLISASTGHAHNGHRCNPHGSPALALCRGRQRSPHLRLPGTQRCGMRWRAAAAGGWSGRVGGWLGQGVPVVVAVGSVCEACW